MPDEKISLMAAASTLTGAELVPIVQGGNNRRTTAEEIAATAPEVTATAAGLVPAGWITGATAAPLPHIHGNLAGVVYEHVRAIGAPIAELAPYHVIGNQGDTATVQIVAADASDPQKMPASGIAPLALAQNADGHGAVVGIITGVDTAAFASGTELYVAAGGGLTSTKPSTTVQAVAVVGRSHATTGSLTVQIGPALPRSLSARSGARMRMDRKDWGNNTASPRS